MTRAIKIGQNLNINWMTDHQKKNFLKKTLWIGRCCCCGTLFYLFSCFNILWTNQNIEKKQKSVNERKIISAGIWKAQIHLQFAFEIIFMVVWLHDVTISKCFFYQVVSKCVLWFLEKSFKSHVLRIFNTVNTL
jgi:hypothetical protein